MTNLKLVTIESNKARTSAIYRTDVETTRLVSATARALQQTSTYRIIEHNDNSWTLTTGVTFRTWGMRINIAIALKGQSSQLTLYVRPKLATTLTDWGKGKAVVKDLVKIIERELSAYP